MDIYDNIKKKVKKEYDDCNQRINKLNKKTIILDANSLKVKTERILVVAVFVFLIMFIVTLGIAMNGGNLLISLNLVKGLFAVVPLLSGVIVDKILTEKYKLKEKLAKISNAKNYSELFEEIIECAMEKAKEKTIMFIFSDLQENIVKQENAFEILATNHNIVEKEELRNIDEINNNIDRLQLEVDDKKKYLLRIIDGLVLKNTYGKFNIYGDIIVTSMMGGTFSFLLTNIPILAIANNFHIPVSIGFFEIIIPFIVTSLVCSIYNIKKYKMEKQAFNNVEYRLRESDKKNNINISKGKQNIANINLVEKLMREISDLLMELEFEKEKRDKLLAVTCESKNNEQDKLKENAIINMKNEKNIYQEYSHNDSDIKEQNEKILKKCLK